MPRGRETEGKSNPVNPALSLKTIQQLGRTFETHADRPAIVAFQESGQSIWSFRDLHAAAQQSSEILRIHGVGPGGRVAIHAANSPGWISAYFAIHESGATVVPVDAQLSGEGLDFVLRDADLSALITTEDLVGKVSDAHSDGAARVLILDPASGALESASPHSSPAEQPVEDRASVPEDPAVLFYTSGTTGQAKGVPLSHANLMFEVKALIDAGLVRDGDRLLLPLPLHHVYPCALGIMVPLAMGLPLIFPAALTGPQLARAVREGQTTVFIGVPRLYRAFYEGISKRIQQNRLPRRMLFNVMNGASRFLRRRCGVRVGRKLLSPLHRQVGPQLRLLASGGSPLDPELAWNLEGLGWEIAVGYGLTETSPLLTLLRSDDNNFSSVGKPIAGVDVKIDTTDDNANGQPDGHAAGEVMARGPNVFNGYRNRPDTTREVLTEDGWFRTGDLGFFDRKGCLHLTGRASTLIVTEAGKNVQPEAVEEAYQKHPAIEEIGVLARDNRIVAVIVPDLAVVRQEPGLDIADAVRNAVRDQSPRLPSYRRLSDYVIDREPLAKTRLGKIRRHLLEERFDALKSGGKTPAGNGASGPVRIDKLKSEDRNLLEQPAARAVWDMLARRFHDMPLSPDTSPQLDLGIDSLEWVSLTFDIRREAGVELDEKAIADIHTVRDLLQATADAKPAGEQAEPASLRDDPFSLLREEQRRWVRPVAPGARIARAGLYAVNWALMKGMFRLNVLHAERLDSGGQFIIAPNHVSYIDSFALGAAIGLSRLRRVFWAALAQAAFNRWFKRGFSRLAQAIPIDPQRGAVSSLAAAAAVLKSGNSLVWYPEGGRSPGGDLQPFKPGIGVLLQHYRVPVIPVHISGTYDVMPVGRMIPRPHRITIAFGPPVSVEDIAEAAGNDNAPTAIADLLHDRVAQLADA